MLQYFYLSCKHEWQCHDVSCLAVPARCTCICPPWGRPLSWWRGPSLRTCCPRPRWWAPHTTGMSHHFSAWSPAGAPSGRVCQVGSRWRSTWDLQADSQSGVGSLLTSLYSRSSPRWSWSWSWPRSRGWHSSEECYQSRSTCWQGAFYVLLRENLHISLSLYEAGAGNLSIASGECTNLQQKICSTYKGFINWKYRKFQLKFFYIQQKFLCLLFFWYFWNLSEHDKLSEYLTPKFDVSRINLVLVPILNFSSLQFSASVLTWGPSCSLVNLASVAPAEVRRLVRPDMK